MVGQTIYNEEMQKKADDYLLNYSALGDAVPSIEGLACHLGVCRATVKNWANMPVSDAYLATYEQIKALQARVTLNKGLTGEFNSAISKLLLHNHGYSDSVKQELSNPDGTLTPQQVDPADVARRVAFMLREAQEGKKDA